MARQPVVEARGGRLLRAEALARWTLPVRGSVALARLMSVAEVAAELAGRGAEPSRVEVELTESVVVDPPALAAFRLGSSTRPASRPRLTTSAPAARRSATSTSFAPARSGSAAPSCPAGAPRPSGALASAMISSSHALGLRVVCEGVKRGRGVEMLTRLGCDLLQGVHLGRPMGIGDLAARWLRSPAEHAVA